jgi:putative glutathione S-transferase
MLVNGKWAKNWDPYQAEGKNGEFIRQTSSFRHWVTPDGEAGPSGDAGFIAEPGRYHLYVAYICPWASRTLMVRALKGLQDVISVSIVEPRLTDEGWRFGNYPGATEDHLHGKHYMHELYTMTDPKVSGRATVPVLWDKKLNMIVNNESADIIAMLNNAFEPWATNNIDIRPKHLLTEIEQVNDKLYHNLNNGVYRAGFAQGQAAYEQAVSDIFNCIDAMENRLQDKKFLHGNQLTESDIRLFVTLIRFDAAYYGLFKCNIRRIADYKNLSSYIERIYKLPGIADTVNMDHIKQGYYSVKDLNPKGIVPFGPVFNFMISSDKGELAA